MTLGADHFIMRTDDELMKVENIFTKVPSQDNCALLCLYKTDRRCLSFAYNFDNQTCELSTHPTIPATQIDPNVVVYGTSDGK